MRVTEQMVFRQSIEDISRQRARLFDLQRQGATGQKIHSIDEEPITVERIRLLRGAREATLHYEKNIERSKTQLETADGALGEATNICIRASELALSMSSEAVSSEQRNIVADEVESLYTSMVGVANTRAAGDYIFGGYLTNTRPFLDDGTFIGNNGLKEVDVGPNARQEVSVSGEEAFTVSGGIDVFQEITDLVTALRTDDVAGIRSALDGMESSMNQIAQARTDSGLKLNQLDVASAVRDRIEDSLTAEESSLLDIDPVEVFTNLSQTSKALQDALAVAQKVSNTSIIGG